MLTFVRTSTMVLISTGFMKDSEISNIRDQYGPLLASVDDGAAPSASRIVGSVTSGAGAFAAA